MIKKFITRKDTIKVNENGYPIYWFDCRHCRGVAQVTIESKPEISLDEMQKYHESGHKTTILSLSLLEEK